MLVALSTIFWILTFSIQVVSVINPQMLKLGTLSYFGVSYETVEYIHEELQLTLITVATGLVFLASIQISLSWLQLAATVHMFMMEQSSFDKFVKRYTVFVKVTFALYILLSLILMGLQNIAGLGILYPVMMGLIVPLYVIGRRRFLHSIDTMLSIERNSAIQASKRSKLLKVKKLINRSSWVTVTCGILTALLWLTLSILFLFAEKAVKPGDVNPAFVVRDIVHAVALAKLSSDYFYIRHVLKSTRNNYLVRKNRTIMFSQLSYQKNQTLKNDAITPKDEVSL